MRKMNYFMLAIMALLIIEIGMASAAPQILTYNYNPTNNTTANLVKLNAASFELVINASGINSICKYALVPGALYNSSSYEDMSYINSKGLYEHTFTGLTDNDISYGMVYNYYVKCNSSSVEPTYLHIPILVDLPIGASISPEVQTDMIPAGNIPLTVTTTKIVSGTPTLLYSFDGINYNKLPLVGAGTSWNTYLVVPSSFDEGVVYFEFSGSGLDGQQVTNLPIGSFQIDTQAPPMITDITAGGYVGEIALNWNLNANNIAYYTIYRSNSPGVQYTDAYKNTTNPSSYTDTGVVAGHTYYYRVAAVDEAGNIADLSKEVSATVLADNTSLNTSGLSPSLVGQVQNFLVQADSVMSNINDIKSSISQQGGEEAQLFSELGFNNALTQAVSQIQSIERSANTLKLQDLTQQELTSQINALTIKLGVAEKQIPESLTIIDHGSDSYVPSSNDIAQALLEFNSSLTQSQVSNAVQATSAFIKSSGFQVNSDYYDVQVTYMDGSTNTLSVVSRQIAGQVEKMNNASFIENIPKDIASSASDVNVVTGAFNVVQADPILSFGTDTKNIVYYVDGQDGIPALQGTSLTLIMTPSSSQGGGSITGGIIQVGSETTAYGGIILGVIIVIALLVYFMFIRKNDLSPKGKEMVELVERIDLSINNENVEKSKMLYEKLKEKYKGLGAKEKKEFYGSINDLPRRISELISEKKEVGENGPR